MQVVKTDVNSFDIKDLTLGKLSALERVLEAAYDNNTLGVVGTDILLSIKKAIKENE